MSEQLLKRKNSELEKKDEAIINLPRRFALQQEVLIDVTREAQSCGFIGFVVDITSSILREIVRSETSSARRDPQARGRLRDLLWGTFHALRSVESGEIVCFEVPVTWNDGRQQFVSLRAFLMKFEGSQSLVQIFF